MGRPCLELIMATMYYCYCYASDIGLSISDASSEQLSDCEAGTLTSSLYRRRVRGSEDRSHLPLAALHWDGGWSGLNTCDGDGALPNKHEDGGDTGRDAT